MGGGNPADPETVALIRRLEDALLVPEVRKSAAQIAALLADEFVEIGSSGRIYDKDQIIGQLQQEPFSANAGTIFARSRQIGQERAPLGNPPPLLSRCSGISSAQWRLGQFWAASRIFQLRSTAGARWHGTSAVASTVGRMVGTFV
jgi:Domain of unknown function (DUF4440)